MDSLLPTIQEVREGGQHYANWYLEHGYILVAVQEGARSASFPVTETKGHQYQYFVRRNPVYVPGRPEGIEKAEGPPRWEPPKKESDEGK